MTRIKLHVLDLGRLRMDCRILIGSGPLPFPGLVEAPISAYCVDHPDGRVLFDTGCHPQSMGPQGRWPQDYQHDYAHLGGEECCLPHRLEQLGLGPNDFRFVVLSHMHSDHAGCTEFFRKSKVIVHRNEYDAAVDAYNRRDERAYSWQDTDACLAAELDWRQVTDGEGDLSLHDEVRILNLGSGHAAGMLGLSVHLRDTGEIVLASDAVYCAENLLERRPPRWLADAAGYQRTLDRIQTMANTSAQIWYGHDPRQFAMLRKSTEGWYE
jgi:glyoxylase-like metal-dependent hydrolase (beta-lactamase superfamily II)